MCPYACFVADVDKRLGPGKPFLQTQLRETRSGGCGERGPGLRMINRAESSRPNVARRSARSLPLRSYSRRKGPRVTRSRSRRVRCASTSCVGPRGQKWPAWDSADARKATQKHRTRHRRSRGRTKSRASLVEGRRSGPGKPRRVTTSRWKRSRRPRRIGPRAPRQGAHRYRAKVATGASEARSRGVVARTPGREEHAPTTCSGDPPKRSVRREPHGAPVSVGGIPSGARPASPHKGNAGDDEPEPKGVWVLVDGVLGSRDGSDASLISFLRPVVVRSHHYGRPQGHLSEWDLARRTSPFRVRRSRD